MNEAIILTLRSGYGEFGMRRHAIRTGNYFPGLQSFAGHPVR